MIIGNFKEEIATLRKDLEKKNMQNNSKVLNDIISSKMPHHEKSALGYNQTENRKGFKLQNNRSRNKTQKLQQV
jgi:hypothetical protein